MFRSGVHDADGEGAGLGTLACLWKMEQPEELIDANPNRTAHRDPGVFQEELVGDWLEDQLSPAGAGVTGNRLGGGRRVVLHGDVGEAQSFTSVEDATTIDRPSVTTGVPYLPGRLPPAAITGELGGFPT